MQNLQCKSTFGLQVFAMRQMVPLLTVGVLDVSASNFRIDCLNYPLTVLEKIQAFLPSFAAYKCDEILLYCKVNNLFIFNTQMRHTSTRFSDCMMYRSLKICILNLVEDIFTCMKYATHAILQGDE